MIHLNGHDHTITCTHEWAGRLTNRMADLVREADPDDPHIPLVTTMQSRIDSVFLSTDDDATVTFTEYEWPFMHGIACSVMFAGIYAYERGVEA